MKEGKKDQAIILEKQRNGLKGSESNSYVEKPEGISIYPLNKAYFGWCMGAIVAFICSLIRLCLLNVYEFDEPLFPEKDNKATAGA